MKISPRVYDLCNIIEEKKAEDITVCNTEKLANAVDFYVLATATSSAHAKGILDFLEEQIKEKKLFENVSREGFNTSSWLVLDVGEGFVHIFTKEQREHYNLEKLVNEGNNITTFEKIKKEYKKQVEIENKKELKSQKKLKGTKKRK